VIASLGFFTISCELPTTHPQRQNIFIVQDIAIHQDQRALISLRRNEIDANSIQRFVIGVLNGLSTRRTFLAMSAFLAYGTSQAVTGLPEAGDKWLVLERTGTKAPEIVTVIRALPPLTVRARFRVLLQISWGYQPLTNGMPAEQELAKARELYSALDRIIGTRGMYAMSRTGDGGRTMYYYVEDVAAQREAIRRYFDAQAPLSIKVTARDEPGWDSVRKVLDAAR
jgi:hypothetical protein